MKSITRYLFLYVSSKFTRKANFRSRFFFFFFFFSRIAVSLTDRILMGNTCELPRMGSRKYFSGHKSLLRDVSGAIDSLTELWMAVERLSPPNKHNARVFSLHCVYTDIRCIEECDKRVISIFLCSFPFLETCQRSSIDRWTIWNNWKANEFEYRLSL